MPQPAENIMMMWVGVASGRLKNVEIGYTLPKAWTSKAGIQNVRIYVQGQNLLTFDNLGDVDMDPEIKNGDGSWFPVQRVINIGLNMTF